MDFRLPLGTVAFVLFLGAVRIMANWHCFKALKRFFLFDVLSNSLFMIEEPVYDYLQGRTVDQEMLPQVEADLADLRAQGLLKEEAEAGQEIHREQLLKALCLHISHDCNLRCKYCFAGTGPFGGDRENMSFETGRAAIDRLLRESGARRQLEVDFFGGEPLLNLDVVRQLVAYGQEAGPRFSKDIHFTLTTNGVALDEEARDFLNREKIAMVLSLDGRPSVNDAMRGQGSYQKVLPNFQALVREREFTNYYLRGTYTAANLDFSRDVAHLYDLGFKELSLEPVVDRTGEYRLTEDNLPAIGAEYEKLAAYYLEKRAEKAGFTFFHFEINLEHGPCLPKRLTGCGAGYDYFAVTPAGEFYPCHQFVGRKEFIMGNVADGITRNDLRREFGAATLYKKEGCAACWSRFYCSGGCHANAHLINGSIYQPDALGCELQRKRLELALALKGIEMHGS
jgi:uncharacterized protein